MSCCNDAAVDLPATQTLVAIFFRVCASFIYCHGQARLFASSSNNESVLAADRASCTIRHAGNSPDIDECALCKR